MSTTDPESVTTGNPEAHRDLTSFQYSILIELAEGSMYGLAVKRELDDYYGSEVNHGRLYPNLDDLVQMGLVEKSALDDRTNEYTLTQLGYGVILDRLETILAHALGDENTDAVQEIINEYAH